MQVIVGRGGAANNLALTHEFENQYDILSVQKPWIGANLDRQLSKKHNGFQAYAQEEVWTDQPRVYTTKRKHLPGRKKTRSASFKLFERSGARTKSWARTRKIHVVNIYNAPVGPRREIHSQK